jgi:hypothetical protein
MKMRRIVFFWLKEHLNHNTKKSCNFRHNPPFSSYHTNLFVHTNRIPKAFQLCAPLRQRISDHDQ